MRKAYFLMILGFVFLAGAFILPYYFTQERAIFISDTADPFLSVASFLLLVSAMFMQREELKIQRKSIDFQNKELQIQSQELELQRREMELQRAELADTRKVFEEQHKTQEIQRFESLFSNMLNVHNNYVSKIGTKIAGIEIYGIEFFGRLVMNMQQKARDIYREDPDAKLATQKAFNIMYSLNELFLNKYMYSIFDIIKFVESNQIVSDKTSIYVQMLTSQLSIPEKTLLYYYINSDKAIEAQKKLFEKHSEVIYTNMRLIKLTIEE